MNTHFARPDRSEQLLGLASARAALHSAKEFQEIREVREQAESIRAYAKRTSLGIDLQNYAAELKLQAERRGGKLLSDLKLRGGNRSGRRTGRQFVRLRDLGIDKNLSARWQLEASVPESVFRTFVQDHFAERREISSSALIAVGRRLREQPIDEIVCSKDAPIHVATKSHLVDLDLDSLRSNGPRLNELNELVSEAQNHYELLFGLVMDLLRQIAPSPFATEHRATTRYLHEVKSQLSEISIGLAKLEQQPPCPST